MTRLFPRARSNPVCAWRRCLGCASLTRSMLQGPIRSVIVDRRADADPAIARTPPAAQSSAAMNTAPARRAGPRLHGRLDTLAWASGWAVFAMLVGWGFIILALMLARSDWALADWRTYAAGAQRLLQGQSLYAPFQLSGPYELRAASGGNGFVYSPPAAVLFVPFSFGDAGAAAWLALNLGVFVGGLRAAIRRELGSIGPWSATAVAALVLAQGGLLSGLFVGSVSPLIAGLFAFCWAGRTSPALAGVLGVVKLLPAALSLWTARSEGVRALLVCVAVGVVLSALTLPVVGISSWAQFVTALENARPYCFAPSIACTVGPVVGFGPATVLGFIVAGGLGIVVVRARAHWLAYAALAGVLVAPAPDLPEHYLLVPLVAIVVIGAHAWTAAGERRRGARRADLSRADRAGGSADMPA